MSRKYGFIVFYSDNDLSGGGHLEDAEPILRNFDDSKNYNDVNEVLELFNIQLYIDHHCYLRAWSEEDINQFHQTVKQFKAVVVKYANTVNEVNFQNVYSHVSSELKPSFWVVCALYRVYDRVPDEIIENLLYGDYDTLDLLLEHKVLVQRYDKVLSNYMRNNTQSIDVIMSAYLLEEDTPRKKPIVPSGLSLQDKDHIISLFLDLPTPNLSLLRIIEQAKDSSELVISDENRLKAKKKAESLFTTMLRNIISFKYSVSMELVDSQQEWVTRLLVNSQSDYKFEYNSRILNGYNDERLITMFADHYEYINSRMLMTMPFDYNKDMVLLEYLSGYRGKFDYPTTSVFGFKQQLAVMQMAFHRQYLSGRGKRLEDLLVWFYENHLREKYGYPSGKLHLAVENSAYIEKIRTILPEIEAILKRYDLFAQKGEVDEELLRIYRGIHFSDTRSILSNKHIYGVDHCKEVFYAIRLLFHPGACMDLLDVQYEGERNLYNMVRQADVKYSRFRNWQQENLDYLIQIGLMLVNTDGFVKLANMNRVEILYLHHIDRVISYWSLPDDLRVEVDKMIDEGLLYAKDEMFSQAEKDYLNYLLNDKSFTNGPALRNTYAHESFNAPDEAHEAAYNYLLMVLVCVLLKIEAELLIKSKQ